MRLLLGVGAFAAIGVMSDGTLSESARPDGTTISEPRFAMLSYSMKTPKFIFLSSDLDLDGNRFWKWLKDSKGPWNTFNTITMV